MGIEEPPESEPEEEVVETLGKRLTRSGTGSSSTPKKARTDVGSINGLDAEAVGCIVSGLEGLKEANMAGFAELGDLLLKVLSRLEAGVNTLATGSNSEAEPELEEEPEAEAEVKAG
jgi:hypothetical protein